VFEALALKRPVFEPAIGILPELTHTSLHLGPVGTMADRIAESNLSVERGIDEEVLDKYSMTAYTDTILYALQTKVHC